MYAVIESGGKQHRVELGSEIQVDRLDVNAGDSITLDRVLLVADGDDAAIGQPVVDGATVSAEVLGQDRGEKIIVFKYKPKARSRVKKGFRAELTTLRITDIAFDGKSAAKDAEKQQKAEAKEAEKAQKAETAAAAKVAKEQAAADKELAAKLAAVEEPAADDAAEASDEVAEAKPKAGKKKSTAKKAAAKSTPEAEAPAEDAEPAPEAAAESDADTGKDE
jgi:large subunit ribosomal protein L21